ncbi:MAG: ADP-ribosylation factor-like protein [Promethearchaeia archaeon]
MENIGRKERILFCGLDNGGKTSILLLLNGKFSLLNKLSPTKKADISTTSISLLGLDVSTWDLGGQRSYRQIYLKSKEKYFTNLKTVYFIIDVQDIERYPEALSYLRKIANIVFDLNDGNLHFFILLHKYDPDLRDENEFEENVDNLKSQLAQIEILKKFNLNYYETSIYNEETIIRAFSDGVISLSPKSESLQTLLKEYMATTFNSAAVLLDIHSFILASRATKDYYQKTCESVAPRLTRAIEKLEEWDINTTDIVTNLKFPIEKEESSREGLIFLRKLDINGKRLYLVTLCLNKRIKKKSYEYLPKLAKKLRNVLKTFQYP